jgi:hypothetical protein
MTGYTYNMTVHLGKDSWECNDSDTSVRHRSGKVEIVGHKLSVDMFFPSPNLCCYLKNRSCHKAIPPDFRDMILKMKWNDFQARVWGDLTAPTR